MMFLYVLACLLCGLFLLISLFLHKRFTYWERRGVVHDKPTFLYGNLREFGRTKPLVQPFRDFYMKYKNKAPFGGFYLFMRPAIVLFDLELVKDILIKDFGNFPHRGNYYNEKDDPLSGHLVNLAGPKWRTMRTKLTPTFTSGKMKFMFPTVVHVANEFVSVFKDLVEKEQKVNALAMDTQETVIEIKDLLARFTTDVIGTCAFGLECNSLKNPQTLFRRMGSKVFTEQRYGKIMNSILNAFPELGRKLHIKLTHDDRT
ncbi:cytochrome P450 6a2-like [Teleopsis dalmanni]|uniref:cytochrome P450 6a2-like n=1 Tax=Teleopsis dalmanni TaxID=139649 RepID=UPI0018CE904F|nr:cytochrome P450 6a2-like [Teleopsis dalmanni]